MKNLLQIIVTILIFGIGLTISNQYFIGKGMYQFSIGILFGGSAMYFGLIVREYCEEIGLSF